MAPVLKLDFDTQAFLTNDDGQGKATIAPGIDGQPQRIALDMVSGENFVQVCAAVPTDTTDPKSARRLELIKGLMEAGTLVSVSGHGVWAKEADVKTVLNTLK